MSGQDILIEQLRAEVERLTKLHWRELLERMEAERERDEWKAKHDTLADVSRACIATTERERDARPDISAEDAALVRDVSGLVGVSRVYRALMVHAAKAVRP